MGNKLKPINSQETTIDPWNKIEMSFFFSAVMPEYQEILLYGNGYYFGLLSLELHINNQKNKIIKDINNNDWLFVTAKEFKSTESHQKVFINYYKPKNT